MKKTILILGGGTFYHVRNHFSIAAPAFGTTAKWLHQQLPQSELLLTRMADSNSKLETNEDVEMAIKHQLQDETLRCIVMNVAMCDFDGQIGALPSGKYAERLKSRDGEQFLNLTASKKVIADLKKIRNDIFLVGFKTTTNHSAEEQVAAAIRMGKASCCDLVLANDTVTRHNMLIHSNGTCVCASFDRTTVLEALVKALYVF